MILSEKSSGESKLNALKNLIARDVMKVIKGIVPLGAEIESDPSQIEGYDFYVTISNYLWRKNIDLSVPADFDRECDTVPGTNRLFDVVVKMMRSSEMKSAFDVNAYALADVEFPEIEIIISFRDEAISSDDYGLLRSDLGNAIRHELEHFTQKGMFKSYDRGEKYYSVSISGDVTSVQAKYFLDRDEIPAFVRGFADESSTISDLYAKIRNTLDRYTDVGNISPIEEEIILSAWMDWAKRNLKKKRFLLKQ